MKAVILAAGVGKRIKGFTRDPKCLIKIKNVPIIVRNIRLLNKYGIEDILIITGYKANKINDTIRRHKLKIKVKKNKRFTKGSILSLWAARDFINEDVIIMDGDLYFEEKLIKLLKKTKKKNFFLIDQTVKKDREAVIVGFNKGRAFMLGRGLKGDYDLIGEWAGILKLANNASLELYNVLKQKILSGEENIGYEFIVPDIFKNIKISYELIGGLKWVEIDFLKDVKKAKSLKI